MAERFAFCKNWTKFLNHFTDERIIETQQSLLKNLQLTSLNRKKFLDIG